MTRILFCIRFLLLALLCSMAPPLHAALEPASPPTLDVLRQQLTAVPARLRESDDIRELMASTRAIQGGAETIAQSRKSQLDELDARLAELGTAPEQGSGGEASDLARQRNELQKQRATADNELKLARLIAVACAKAIWFRASMASPRMTECNYWAWCANWGSLVAGKCRSGKCCEQARRQSCKSRRMCWRARMVSQPVPA